MLWKFEVIYEMNTSLQRLVFDKLLLKHSINVGLFWKVTYTMCFLIMSLYK
jgi:hypothetical protein